jgi:hypothetical protein
VFTVCLPRIEEVEVELVSRPDFTFPSGSWSGLKEPPR